MCASTRLQTRCIGNKDVLHDIYEIFVISGLVKHTAKRAHCIWQSEKRENKNNRRWIT